MPDFCSSGLWNLADGCMLDTEEAGLSDNIKKALDSFVEYYDREATDRPSYRVKKSQEKRLNHMGRLVAEMVKSERPDLEVMYWGEDSKGNIFKENVSKARSSDGTEHLPYKQRVGSSSLPVPTKKKRGRP